MSHDQMFQALAGAAEVCFWVLLISTALMWCGYRGMLALSRALPPGAARDRINGVFGELVPVLIKLGLVAALGPVLVRFMAQNTHAAEAIRFEGFAALLIWLRVSGMVVEGVASQLKSSEGAKTQG